MSDPRRIFVILDPTTMNQPSLVMAETLATDMLSGEITTAAVHIYCCIAKDDVYVPEGMVLEPALDEEAARTRKWVDRLATYTRDLGLEVTTEVEVQSDWRAAIVAAINRQNCLLAVKNVTRHSRLRRLVRQTSDWRLLRGSTCPVLLVKSYARRKIRTVLVAIKHRPEKKIYRAANDRLLETGREIASTMGAELHVVTAYRDNADYPDRQRFADRCGLPRNKVIAVMGKPHEAIATAARELQADLVVIARVGRLEDKSQLGHTAEKVIDEIDANLLVLPMTGQS